MFYYNFSSILVGLIFNQLIFQVRLASNQFPSAANVEIKKEIEDEWWWEDVLDRFAPSVATSSKQDCETESIVSSAAWDNNKISFRWLWHIWILPTELRTPAYL